MLAVTGDGPSNATDTTDAAAAPAPPADAAPEPQAPQLPVVDPDELAGPGFGAQQRAAVARVLPGLEKGGQMRGDHYLPLDDTGTFPMAVETPVSWETFFNWTSFFDAPGSSLHVDVASTRESPTPVQITGSRDACRADLYPYRATCSEDVVDGRTVVTSDGIRFEEGGTWFRQVEVYGPQGERDMEAKVVVSAFSDARTRAAANRTLPSLDDLQRLALDPDLVLPEPAAYPDEFPE
ncbi:hypothetical protein GCM10023340_31030 [Nocardioides marinquilinus]|uniref:Uncharacterized protein n=1 Tax=Nocardioides marinquilinus TaxID=1210400 RepID=A0ABP9PUG5_9ACTN